jgi:hypothetical protein
MTAICSLVAAQSRSWKLHLFAGQFKIETQNQFDLATAQSPLLALLRRCLQAATRLQSTDLRSSVEFKSHAEDDPKQTLAFSEEGESNAD